MTLEAMIDAAESGDTALWEDIAKLLLRENCLRQRITGRGKDADFTSLECFN